MFPSPSTVSGIDENFNLWNPNFAEREYKNYGYGAEHILSMNVVLADGSIGSVDKVRCINQSGASIHHYWPITGQNNDILPQSPSHLSHSYKQSLPGIKVTWALDHPEKYYLCFRGSGSSFGIVTEFLYMINETWGQKLYIPKLTYLFKLRPEADPAVLLAWIENDLDLANIHRAARVREDVSL